MFKCKCCEVLKAERDHLRKWIDRLMEQKAPDVSHGTSGALEVPVEDEMILFETQE
jgi:hypothetical protein